MSEKIPIPPWLGWVMTFINRIGFPIAVCIYLGYMQLSMMPEIVKSLASVNIALSNVEKAIKESTEASKIWRYSRSQREN